MHMPLHSVCCEQQHKYTLVLRWLCKPACPGGSPVCHSKPDSKKWVDFSLPKLEMKGLYLHAFFPSFIPLLLQGTSVFASLSYPSGSLKSTCFVLHLLFSPPHLPTEYNRLLLALKAAGSGQKTKSSNFPSKSSVQNNNEIRF